MADMTLYGPHKLYIATLNPKCMEKALECLKNGGVIIYPTENSYSFGCDAKNEEAIKKIHKIKQEEPKPISILVSSLEQIEEFGVMNETALKLFKKFMPGRINLIIDKKDLSKVGISFRISPNKTAFELSRVMPITTTSVNIHGQSALYDIKKIKELFEDKVCYMLDEGDLDESMPASTIYDTRNNKILREGPITEEEIKEALSSPTSL